LGACTAVYATSRVIGSSWNFFHSPLMLLLHLALQLRDCARFADRLYVPPKKVGVVYAICPLDKRTVSHDALLRIARSGETLAFG
jgi:hypothetical protein